jgi:uncharacterized protein YaaR (DUF327 family)
MQKRVLSTFILTALFLTGACKKDDDTRCDAEARAVSDAGVIYANLQTTQNCLLYKAAIAEYLASPCSSSLSSSDRLQLQNVLNNLPC